jgi:cysteine desulfurase
VAGILHLRFAGVEAEAAVVLLDQAGIAASAGAACSSGAVEPSHVLAAMGLEPAEASSGVRFSLGAVTTDEDVDHALARVPDVVIRLRN